MSVPSNTGICLYLYMYLSVVICLSVVSVQPKAASSLGADISNYMYLQRLMNQNIDLTKAETRLMTPRFRSRFTPHFPNFRPKWTSFR